jgi:hypothetical protein
MVPVRECGDKEHRRNGIVVPMASLFNVGRRVFDGVASGVLLLKVLQGTESRLELAQ